jgi:hypothetical protein
MPIAPNLNLMRLPGRALVDAAPDLTAAAPSLPTAPAPPGLPGGGFVVPPPPPASPAAPPIRPPLDVPIRPLPLPTVPTVPTFPTVPRPPIFQPPIFQPPIFQPPPAPPVPMPPPKTATQLARGALAQLNAAGPDKVNRAINAISSAGISDGAAIMTLLERKTRIRAILDAFAASWDQTTKSDFADAFPVPADQTDVMDAIVSLAILNDRDLEAEIIAENSSQTSPGDLTDNRQIVWQYPPAGTVLQPPYVILVAVEFRDVASAEDIFHSVADQLGPFTRGQLTLRVPKTVAQSLG